MDSGFQLDGQVICDVLAAQVKLSPSATLRRGKRIRESGPGVSASA